MPHSLRVRLKNLQRKGELTEKDIDRIFKALSQEPCDDVKGMKLIIDIPDNATNGDILKMLIPMDCYGDKAEKFYGYIEWNCSKWWNAPYQKGGKE